MRKDKPNRTVAGRPAMRLAGSNGSLFEMSVVGYEFPDVEADKYDSNWLRIWIHVVHPRGEWTCVDPSLLTWEVEALAKWFDAIAEGRTASPIMVFTEVNLSFRLLNHEPSGKSLAIYFELESLPQWAKSERVLAQDMFVEFPLRELDLPCAAEQLREELARYPQRAER